MKVLGKLGGLREEIHKKSHAYMVFKMERRKENDWSKFYGCTDSLWDAEAALVDLLRQERKATLLECYGFLQTLVTQQDAVEHLSKSVGLTSWNPRDCEILNSIRFHRNQISAHSAWSNQCTSSIINSADITSIGFKATIYGGNRPLFEEVNFKEYVKKNCSNLIPQLQKISERMDVMENEFKAKRSDFAVSSFFSKDSYLLQRLWCNLKDEGRVGQAKGHAGILKQRLSELAQHIGSKKIHEVSKKDIKKCLYGLDLIQNFLNSNKSVEKDQWEFDFMIDGWEKSYVELKESVARFDENVQK